MFDPIDNLSRVMPSGLTSSAHSTGSVKAVVSPSDQVDVPSPDLALNSFRSQASALKNELPAMVSQSLQPSAKGGQNEPLSAVAFRLTDPLNFILKGDSFTKDQLDGFQKEVSKFRDEIMGMKAPSGQANARNEILSQITSHLDGVAGQIQNKIMSI